MRKYILSIILTLLLIPSVVLSWDSSPFGPVPPSDLAYNAATWNGSYLAATQNSLRDQIELMIAAYTIGGVDTQVQYNDGGAFGGDVGLTYNDGTNLLEVGVDGTTPGNLTLHDEGDLILWDDGNDQSVRMYVIDGLPKLKLMGQFDVSGSATVGNGLYPDSAGGSDIGSATNQEWGDFYIDDDKYIQFGEDQDIRVGYDEAGDDRLEWSDGTNLLAYLTDGGAVGNFGVTGSFVGTSIDIGTTTAIASRQITVDTGGGLDINMGTASGDDFTVDTSAFVVEGDLGRVGIGTALPSVNAEIEGENNGSCQLFIEGTHATTAEAGIKFRIAEMTAGWAWGLGLNEQDRFIISREENLTGLTDGGAWFIISTTGQINMPGYANGDVTFTGGTGLITTSSSIDEKDVTGTIANATDLLKQYPNGKYYKWKDTKKGTERQFGFIAQEVNVVHPEAAPKTIKVKFKKDKDGEDTDKIKSTKEEWGLYNRATVALLVQGFKEQQAEIEGLKVRLAALEN